MTRRPVDAISATEACALAGITYRQLDYWARQRWVRPSVDSGVGRAGRRLYHPADVVRLAALGHFGRAGLDVGKLGPALAELELPLGSDFLIASDGEGVAVVPGEDLRLLFAEPRPRVVFDPAALAARLGFGAASPEVERIVRSA
jgi:DNA-binding transcriptional MerR regulator